MWEQPIAWFTGLLTMLCANSISNLFLSRPNYCFDWIFQGRMVSLRLDVRARHRLVQLTHCFKNTSILKRLTAHYSFKATSCHCVQMGILSSQLILFNCMDPDNFSPLSRCLSGTGHYWLAWKPYAHRLRLNTYTHNRTHTWQQIPIITILGKQKRALWLREHLLGLRSNHTILYY